MKTLLGSEVFWSLLVHKDEWGNNKKPHMLSASYTPDIFSPNSKPCAQTITGNKPNSKLSFVCKRK